MFEITQIRPGLGTFTLIGLEPRRSIAEVLQQKSSKIKTIGVLYCTVQKMCRTKKKKNSDFALPIVGLVCKQEVT